jgi:hypothetical protein
LEDRVEEFLLKSLNFGKTETGDGFEFDFPHFTGTDTINAVVRP